MEELSLRAQALKAAMQAPNGKRRDKILHQLTGIDPEFAVQFDALVGEFCAGGELSHKFTNKQHFIDFLLRQPQLKGVTCAALRSYIQRRESAHVIEAEAEAAVQDIKYTCAKEEAGGRGNQSARMLRQARSDAAKGKNTTTRKPKRYSGFAG